MNGFHLRLEAFDALGTIQIQIISRELPQDVTEDLPPISVVSTSVQAPEDGDRRAWLQDALIAALEAL